MVIGRLIALGALVTALFAMNPAGASASIEIGSHCSAMGAAPAILVQTVNPGDATFTAPSAGVITRWGTTVDSVGGQTKIKVVRLVPPSTYEIVSESSLETVVPGSNTFNTRLPIAAGEQIGIYSALAQTYCPSAPPAYIGAPSLPMDPAPGGSFTATTGTNAVLGIFATIEPDVDADGYGDETQDLCVQSAKFHDACPKLGIAKYGVAGEGFYRLLITTTQDAPVTVSGSARIPAYGGNRAKTVKLKTLKQTVAPGQIAKFKVKYPRSVRTALRSLPKSAKVKLAIKIKGVGFDSTTTKNLRVTVRGTR